MAAPEKFGEEMLEIYRIFDAPRALVWQAWTDPKMMAEWFGPRHFTSTVVEFDVRPGGALKIVMRGPDGNDYPCEGVFREVVPLERLVFTNNAVDKDGTVLLEGQTMVLFTELKDKTKMSLMTRAIGRVPIATQMLAGMEKGWEQSMDKLAKALVR